MTRAHVLGLATLCVAAISCSSDAGQAPATLPTPPAQSATPGAAGTSAPPAAGAAGRVATGAAGASGVPASTTGSAAGAPSTAAAAGSSAGSSGSAAGSAGDAGSSAANGGSVAAEGGSGGTVAAAGAPAEPSGEIPAPLAAPLIWGFGVGITDVPAAVTFFSEVMEMTVEKDAVERDDRTDTVLYGTQAMRGARLVLMKFDDMRNTRKITAKVVWQAQNASAVDRAASMYPDYESRLSFGIVQFDGPETYVHEVGGIFDTAGGDISVPYPIALGFAVSDLAASRMFYTSLGMTESSLGSFSVTDANGSGNITEYSVKFTDGAGVVLQQWTPMRNTKDNPIGFVMFVPEAQAMADKVVSGGGTIVKPAERSQAYDNRLLIVAKDPDGYLLDIVE